MAINIPKIVGIINDPKFKKWALENNTTLKPSGDKFRDQIEVLNWFNQIKSQKGLFTKFEQFIDKEFPFLVSNKSLNVDYRNKIVGAGLDENGIFPFYNPIIMTFPMRIILYADNKNELLDVSESFINHHSIYDIIVIGKLSYIEYIPKRLSNHMGKIPASNWCINKYRNSKQI